MWGEKYWAMTKCEMKKKRKMARDQKLLEVKHMSN